MGRALRAGVVRDWRCTLILLPSAVRVYVAAEAVNLRQSFEGLQNAVRCVIRRDPLSGHVFAFINKRRTQVKLLVWTRGGFTIVHKRLERGSFAFDFAAAETASAVEIGADELALLLEGVDARTAKRSRRWQPQLPSSAITGAAA